MSYRSSVDLGERTCKRPECDTVFSVNRVWKEYCSSQCRSQDWYQNNKAAHNARRAEKRRERGDAE